MLAVAVAKKEELSHCLSEPTQKEICQDLEKQFDQDLFVSTISKYKYFTDEWNDIDYYVYLQVHAATTKVYPTNWHALLDHECLVCNSMLPLHPV